MTTDQALAETNIAIKQILQDSRNEYKARKEENFDRVLHDYKDPQNGFKKWKSEMEKII
ncbi:MAG: hypothetical protein HYZ15_14630 [Sphingobacteriales bacterium]|nr:hypothetical protein [Sphingobacteriales bacterium]